MVEQPMETAVDPELPAIDTQLLRQLIHQKLQELKHGDLFMDGLGEECFSTVLSNEKYYDVFTTILGTAWMDIHSATNTEKGLNGGKMKRKKKKFIKAVRQARDFVWPEIEYCMSLMKHTPRRVVESKEQNGKESHPDGKNTETPPHEIEDNKNPNEMDDVSSINSHSTSRYSKSSSKKKKKKSKKVKKKHRKEKRKYNKKGKERKRRSRSDESDDEDSNMGSPIYHRDGFLQDEDEVAVRYTKAEAKEMFEKEKTEILSQVPKDVKSQFRSLAFCKWSKDFLPCIQLSPYDVSPGPVRDSWMEMFSNCQNKRPLTRLIFWYGTAMDAMDAAYSFVQEKNLISFEEGCAKGHDKIPSKITKKLDRNVKLTKNEEQHVRGLTEIKDDSNKSPEDRLNWLEEWQEDHELMKENGEIEASDDDLFSKSSKEQTPPKKKRGRKRKSEIADEEGADKKKPKPGMIQHALLETKDGASNIKKKKKLKKITSEDLEDDNPAKIKKSKKYNKLNEKESSNDLEDSDSDVPPKKKKLKKKLKNGKKDNLMNEQVEADNEEVLNEEIPSDDDRDDDFNASAPNSDEELDNDYNNTVTEIESKKNKSSPRKPKKKKQDQVLTEEAILERRLKDFQRRERLRKKKCEEEGIPFVPKVYKPKGRKKKLLMTEAKETEDVQSLGLELTDECERIFLPIMKGLDKANKAIDESLAIDFLQQILEHVELITPTFVREQKIGMLIKKTRKGFGGSYPEVERKCREVTADLKRVFTEKEKNAAACDQKQRTSAKTKASEESKIKKEVPEVNSDDASESITETKPEIPTKHVKVKDESSYDNGDMSLKSTDDFSSEIPAKTAIKQELPPEPLTSSIPKKDSQTSLSLSGKVEMEETPKVEKTKPAKKSFSLARMFEKPKKTPTSMTKTVDRSMNRSPVKQITSWLTEVVEVKPISPNNPERESALKLLTEAVSFFPSGRFNKNFVAKLMESAVFEWSNSISRYQRGGTYSKSPMKAYWEKIDDIVAALVGNKSNGGILISKLLEGEFATVGDFIKLPRKTLNRYYLGKAFI